MNTPNPLIPQGSLQSRGKSTVRIAFFSILAIHVLVFGGLLMQGCKKSEDKPVAVEEVNEELAPLPPIDLADTNIEDTNYAAPVVSNPPAVNIPPPVYNPPPVIVPEPTPATREYVVTKGDSFSSIAKKLGVSVKGIEQANPGVNPSRLQIGQKLQIPAAGDSSASSTLSAPSSSNGTTYVVKSGDMLEKIARRNGTTVKEIMRLNNLKTTMIRVGQKLKMPSTDSSESNAASPDYVTPLQQNP